MQTRLMTPQLVITLVCVTLLVVAATITFHIDKAELSTATCLLFAIKAITTSGTPDSPSPVIERFLIVFLPVGVFAWACMIDAIVNRR
jgi:hypothetical protein